MPDDFLELLDALLSHQARFLVVGAHALAAHGVPRATGDLDVWIDRSPDNAARVWAALADFGAPLQALDVDQRDLTRLEVVVQFGLPPRRIDVLTGVTGLSFPEAWEGRVENDVDGLQVPFLGRDSLVRNKRATGRPRDLADIDALERQPPSP